MAGTSDMARDIVGRLKALGVPVEKIEVTSKPETREMVFTISMKPEPEEEVLLTKEEYITKLRSLLFEWTQMVEEWVRSGIIDETAFISGAVKVSKKLLGQDPDLLGLLETLEKSKCWCHKVGSDRPGFRCDRCDEIKRLSDLLRTPPRVTV